MVVGACVGHVAAKDVPKLVLISASDTRVRRLVSEFDAVELGASLGASHDALLLTDPQSFPVSCLVLPLLKQQDPPRPRHTATEQPAAWRNLAYTLALSRNSKTFRKVARLVKGALLPQKPLSQPHGLYRVIASCFLSAAMTVYP